MCKPRYKKRRARTRDEPESQLGENEVDMASFYDAIEPMDMMFPELDTDLTDLRLTETESAGEPAWSDCGGGV